MFSFNKAGDFSLVGVVVVVVVGGGGGGGTLSGRLTECFRWGTYAGNSSRESRMAV